MIRDYRISLSGDISGIDNRIGDKYNDVLKSKPFTLLMPLYAIVDNRASISSFYKFFTFNQPLDQTRIAFDDSIDLIKQTSINLLHGQTKKEKEKRNL